ncbi:MAG: pentapeptide repeat-containing protein [Proteobacteria bacterium]|nr:pentapeptide repeat-containing protein [Pseudomonadota bacterium]MBU1416998.1 pentapeptide repeat-containing protein [Pseudomonadota bacterium]
MFGVKRLLFSGFALLPLSIITGSALCGQLSTSIEVQGNINTLQQTKSCPQCDLSGADLNRMDLSGANLEGANLSRAKLNLTNLSRANLRNADLRDVGFGGADLADADLRGADLRGTSFAGAYMSGVLLDGELITTTPYVQEQISNVEETIYVEDTVKPKTVPKTEEMNISARRDFEEIPPTLPADEMEVVTEEIAAENTLSDSLINEETVPNETLVPQQSAAAPEAKAVPSIQQVRMAAPYEKNNEIAHDETSGQEAEVLTEGEIRGGEQPLTATLTEATDSIESEGKVIASISQNQQVQTTNTTEVPDLDVPAIVEQVSKQELTTADEAEQETEIKVIETDLSVVAATPEQSNSDQKNDVDPSVATEAQHEIGKDGEETNIESVMEQTVLSLGTEVLRNVETLLDTNQCYGCNLEGADLSGKDLEASDLEGANLRQANLKGTDLEGANLKGTNLSGADLRKADLDGADLYKADLTGADLTEASLDKTLIDDAILTGVKGYKQETLLMME